MTNDHLAAIEMRARLGETECAEGSDAMGVIVYDVPELVSEVRRLNSTLATMAALGEFFKLIDFMAPRYVNVWTVAMGAERDGRVAQS